MNTPKVLLGVVALAAFGAAIWWQTRSAPVETTAAAPAAAKPAPAVPAPRVAAPIMPLKAEVVAPAEPPAASAKPAESAKSAGRNPELDAAVNDFLAVLDSQDTNLLVQNYMVPSMVEMAMSQANSRMPADATPEMRAQLVQTMQQQMPRLIERISQQMAQDPRAMQSFQKLGAALRRAQANPPQMSDGGDKATYALDVTDDKDMPPSVVMVRRDGKWTLDFMAMSQGGARGGF